jgi:hypothetical protein
MIKCALYYDSNLFTNDEKCQVGITKIQDFIIIIIVQTPLQTIGEAIKLTYHFYA